MKKLFTVTIANEQLTSLIVKADDFVPAIIKALKQIREIDSTSISEEMITVFSEIGTDDQFSVFMKTYNIIIICIAIDEDCILRWTNVNSETFLKTVKHYESN